MTAAAVRCPPRTGSRGGSTHSRTRPPHCTNPPRGPDRPGVARPRAGWTGASGASRAALPDRRASPSRAFRPKHPARRRRVHRHAPRTASRSASRTSRAPPIASGAARRPPPAARRWPGRPAPVAPGARRPPGGRPFPRGEARTRPGAGRTRRAGAARARGRARRHAARAPGHLGRAFRPRPDAGAASNRAGGPAGDGLGFSA